MTKDVIISFDLETYGPIPGLHSAASLGAVAYSNGKKVGEFYAVFEELKHAGRDPDTMKWWEKQPAAWKEIHTNQEPPKQAMERFYNWAVDLPGTARNRVFAANPATYDMPFLSFYCYKFLYGRYEDISYRLRCIDIRSYFAGLFGYDYSTAERYRMPKEWFGEQFINHIAVDDARQQGHGLMNMISMATMDEEN